MSGAEAKDGRRGASDTRREILGYLKKKGALDAETLGQLLGVTSVAVRQHLGNLASEGYVDYEDVVQGRGRPSRRWSLTESAAQFFPDAYDELLLGLLSAIGEAFGEGGASKVLQEYGQQQKRNYLQELGNAPNLEERLEILAKLRSQEGYMAEVRASEDGKGWLLIQNHCAICKAAAACAQLCNQEAEAFREVLGQGAKVSRTEHLLAGSHRCVYLVEENSPKEEVLSPNTDQDLLERYEKLKRACEAILGD